MVDGHVERVRMVLSITLKSHIRGRVASLIHNLPAWMALHSVALLLPHIVDSHVLSLIFKGLLHQHLLLVFIGSHRWSNAHEVTLPLNEPIILLTCRGLIQKVDKFLIRFSLALRFRASSCIPTCLLLFPGADNHIS